jgi:hypothetical protein
MSGLCVYGDGKPRRPNSPLCVSHGEEYDLRYTELVKEGAAIAREVFAGRKTDEELVDDVIMFGANAGISVKVEDARAELGIKPRDSLPGLGEDVCNA